jgi:hypothetical protein
VAEHDGESLLRTQLIERPPDPVIAPTDRTCAADESVICRIADGKIAEAWEVCDEAGMWRQLGVIPPGSPA